MSPHTVPAVLLAQGGGHDHVLTVGVNIGPTVLRIVFLVAVPVVAAFGLLRGFLTEPDRRAHAAVISCAGGAVVLSLMLSDGLDLSERLVPLLLALLALPLYLVLSSDPRFSHLVGFGRRFAPWVFWAVAVLAGDQFVRAWLGGGSLYTGVVLGLVAMAWFVVSRPRAGAGTVGVRVGAALLAMLLIAGAGQAVVS